MKIVDFQLCCFSTQLSLKVKRLESVLIEINQCSTILVNLALGRSVDCETIDWLKALKTTWPYGSVGQKSQGRIYTKSAYTQRPNFLKFTPIPNIHQGRIIYKPTAKFTVEINNMFKFASFFVLIYLDSMYTCLEAVSDTK